jgi:hypothetical protein
MLNAGEMGFIIEWFQQSTTIASGFIILSIGNLLLVLKIVMSNIALFHFPAPLLLSDAEKSHTSNPDILYEFFKSEAQVIIYWNDAKVPNIIGDINQLKEDIGHTDPLLFSAWLRIDDSKEIESYLANLRMNGTPFQIVLKEISGKYFEFYGRIINDMATLKIKNIDQQKQNHSKLKNECENLKIETVGLRAMLNTLSHPIWVRERSGRLSWVNEQYAYAVDADDTSSVISAQTEFLDSNIQSDAMNALKNGEVFQIRIPVIVSGQRRILDIVETPLVSGSIGYAIDVSDLEAIRNDLQRQMASHALTLDQLPTAVAIFDERQCLVFCNVAYRTLWQIDEEFTQSKPTDNEVLDYLRNARRLPEQADYKSWKKSLHEAYHSLETHEAAWYLPSGRTLRVVVNPTPQGGITYLFEDITAQFILQSNFNALSRVQSETLDSLKEGVAVFGMDGRLKLNNPAFETIWEIDGQKISQNPHIDEIIKHSNQIYDAPIVWNNIKGIIGGFNDTRKGYSFRMELNNGTIVDCTLAPLSDGATLMTFVDISASVNVERALKDRNEALEHAARLRENFVHHVSYQLRSPLTNVIGFTELLASGAVGQLTQKQSEYIDHVLQSSNSLMTIIDDILDLASFDRGEIILERKQINIKDAINTAIEAHIDRLTDRNLILDINIAEDVNQFFLDKKRIQQILFNLLSNSIGFSSDGQLISVTAKLQKSYLNITIKDYGRGIPEDVIQRVFDRFETYTIGSRHRGAGLGLSIVRSLVELHGGTVSIESKSGKGTVVSCFFPPENFKSFKIEANL